MGQHSSAESLMAGVESDGIRVKCKSYALLLTGWLNVPVTEKSPLDALDSDVVEILRGVRDILEAVARG